MSSSSDRKMPAEGVYANLIDGVTDNVQSFYDLAQKYSLPLKADDLIAAGGIAPCIALLLRQMITASFAGLGGFSFMVQENTDG